MSTAIPLGTVLFIAYCCWQVGGGAGMSIGKYTGPFPNRRFDVNQALRDGGWAMDFEALRYPLRVRDRKTGQRATVTSVTFMPDFGMYRVQFKTHGWLLLDHAVEQYEGVRK